MWFIIVSILKVYARMNILNKIKSKQTKTAPTAETQPKKQPFQVVASTQQANPNVQPVTKQSDEGRPSSDVSQQKPVQNNRKSVNKIFTKLKQNPQKSSLSKQSKSSKSGVKMEEAGNSSQGTIKGEVRKQVKDQVCKSKLKYNQLKDQDQNHKQYRRSISNQEKLSKGKNNNISIFQVSASSCSTKYGSQNQGVSSRLIKSSFGDSNRISEKTQSRLSDLSDQALPILGDSFTKLPKLQKSFNWTHPSLKNLAQPPPQPPPPVCEPLVPTPNSYTHILHIRKGYQIGRMSIFEGTLQAKKVQEKDNKKYQIRIRQTETIKLSCKLELVPNPQSIALLYLNNLVEIGEREYLVSGVVGAVEKPGSKR